MKVVTNDIGHLYQEWKSDRPDMDTFYLVFPGYDPDLWVKQEYREPFKLPKWMTLL